VGLAHGNSRIPTTASKTQFFAQAMADICELHLNETKTWEDRDKAIYGRIVVRDNINSVIFEQLIKTLMNASQLWKIDLPLFSDSFELFGVFTGDFIQFPTGKSMWSTNDTDSSFKKSTGWCQVGGWDPRYKGGIPGCNSAFQTNPTTPSFSPYLGCLGFDSHIVDEANGLPVEVLIFWGFFLS
jgi:hypothetical protein